MNRSLREKLCFEAKRFGAGCALWQIIRKATGSYYAASAMGRYYEKHIHFLRSLSEGELIRYVSDLYTFKTGDTLNIKAPENYNQKIQWLKIYDNLPIKCPLSDKYKVREWVSEKIGDKYLVPLLGVWDNPDEIDFAALPERFCLKANHASGTNIIVRDKSALDTHGAKRTMRTWLNTPFGVNMYEPNYFDIPRKIISEKFIEQMDGDLADYKIHCFDGEPGIIQVIGGRDFHTHTAREAFFSPDWTRNDLMYHTYEQYKDTPERPDSLDEMLNVAAKLSAGFKYVRVDLYSLNEGVKFGEMTFYPMGGCGTWASEQSNKTVGDMIRI